MSCKTVIVASLNPAKINAVKSAFESTFPEQDFEFIGVSVASEVAEQPMSDSETYQGACNRVRNAKLLRHDANYYVGLEAGVEEGVTFAWMVIESDTHRGQSRSASMMLPPKVASQLSANMELGTVMDQTFGTTNIKQQGGAIGLLTQHQLTRSSVYHQALVLALIPFTNPNHYSANL
ncbi:inosine/xanthosine triphosphatase [Vibrio taketomensis]|uniref:inosine/xanthosine triphosphatase n=1 Tax=Vibrio taketomensis TaxID=2572923 RepID=UPI001389EEF4|nr:inosine/xanthosine triphosphatase [Vibrio taketomensis]